MTLALPQTESDVLALIPVVLADAEVGHVLRFLPGKHALVEGVFRGTPAIFRVALGVKEVQDQAALWAEVQRIGPAMATGNFQINQGLAFAEEKGVLALQRAPGKELLPLLKTSRDSAHLRRLSDWLAHYAAPSLKTRRSAPAYWLKQATRASDRQPHADLRAKELHILERMQTLASDMASMTWRVAITHGDYHPNNLFWDGKTLTGIDIGGSAELPIYKDMARSLVHLARRDIFCGPGRSHGVDSAGISAFCRSFALSSDEETLALPFFIGFECLIKTEQPDAPKWRLEAANALYDGYLAAVV